MINWEVSEFVGLYRGIRDRDLKAEVKILEGVLEAVNNKS